MRAIAGSTFKRQHVKDWPRNMADAPSRPQRPTNARTLSQRAGNLSANAVATPSVEMGVIGTPANMVDNSLMKFAQLILFGIAMVGIWAGLLRIAFPGDGQETGQAEFLVLGFGGLFSGFLAIALVEFQRRKGGSELQNVHDYMLGVGFFFLAVGTLWGSRWLVGELALQGVDWFIPEGTDPSAEGWIPSANAIYVQMAATLSLALAQTVYLMRLKGVTTFGWSVTTFTPLVVALIGSSIWMEWSNNIVSWELGISMIALASLSMWLSLRANSGIIFSVVAVTSGLLPLLYEYNNEDVGNGGAISLLVFIIAVQGTLAADRRLRQDLMQWTSALLVGEVILAMLIAREQEFELILGPIRQYDLGTLSPYLTLQVGLWLAVLIAYFPATLMRRIPYMPIGLAASLFIITPTAGLIPWVTTLIMLPYLLVISKVTRNWVANLTMLAVGFSFFAQSHYTGGFEPGWLEFTILVVVLFSGEIGRKKGHLSDWAHFVTLGLLVLSESVLFGDDPYTPWALFLYAIISSFMMMMEAEKSGDKNVAFNASAATAGSMIIAIILSVFDRLEVPLPDNISSSLDGFNITLALVGLIVYASMRKFKRIELDIGVLINWAEGQRKKVMPVFDSSTNAWVVPQDNELRDPMDYSWGPLGRMSLIGPMVLFTVALTSVGLNDLAQNITWTLLMLVPIGIIIAEVIREEQASSSGRMIATLTMIAVAAPMAWSLNDARSDFGVLENSMILFDLMLLAGPLGISIMLDRKGLNEDSLNRSADITTLMGLLILGLFDTTGGLLFIPMYILVFVRALKHRLAVVLCIAPVAFLLFGDGISADRFVTDGAIVAEILGVINLTAYDPTEVTFLNLSRFAFLMMTITNLVVLVKAIIDKQYEDEIEFETPVAIPAIWMTIGVFGVLPEASWILLSLTILLTIYSWLIGKLDLIPWTPVLTFFSFWIGFTNDSNFNHFDDIDYITNSLLGTGLFTLVLNQCSAKGWLYKYADETVAGVEYSIDGQPIVSVFDLRTELARDRLTTITRTWTIVCLTFSWTALKGIGTIIGAIWATYDAFANGQKYSLFILPLLHAFAVWNVLERMDQTDALQDTFVGSVLMVCGILLTIIASKADLAWNWKIFDWDDEIEYYGWIDRAGQLGIVYFLSGISWALGETNLEQFMWVVWAAFLSGIAVQGFRDETETPWRRGFGSMGTVFSLFMLSLTFDTELYTNVTWMFMGVVALGFGFAYFSRMGEVSTLFTEDFTQAKDAIMGQFGGGDDEEEEIEAIPEPVHSEEDTEDDSEEIDEAEDLDEVIDIDEDEDVVEEVQPLLKQEIEDTIIDKAAEIVEEAVEQEMFEYDLLLDPSVMSAIQESLASTPHEGFKPVVSVSPSGNLKIDFVPL